MYEVFLRSSDQLAYASKGFPALSKYLDRLAKNTTVTSAQLMVTTDAYVEIVTITFDRTATGAYGWFAEEGLTLPNGKVIFDHVHRPALLALGR